MTKFFLACCLLSIVKLCKDGLSGNDWWILELALILGFFFAAAISSSMQYDKKMLKEDPTHFTTGDAFKVLGLFYVGSWLFKDKSGRD